MSVSSAPDRISLVHSKQSTGNAQVIRMRSRAYEINSSVGKLRLPNPMI